VQLLILVHSILKLKHVFVCGTNLLQEQAGAQALTSQKDRSSREKALAQGAEIGQRFGTAA